MKNACLSQGILLSALLLASAPSLAADVAPLGAAEELAAMPELQKSYPKLPAFGKGDLFLVFAHADDELTVLAQVARYRELAPHRAIHWILVSNNAKGMVLPGTCVFQSKSECRYKEASKVASCIGIQKPEPMGLPDGGLDQVADLKERIRDRIEALRTGPVAAILSHDNAGLYGHPDHVAVHDAARAVAKASKIPFVAVALTEHFKQKIEVRDPFKNRVRPAITHALDLAPAMQKKMACAHKAHKSQALLLQQLRQGLSPEQFFKIVDRVFLNLEK